MAIVHPGAREEIKQLTSRSLLGVSALRLDNAEERWQKAVFETALEYGHPYVREIFSQTLPKNKIPGWYVLFPSGGREDTFVARTLTLYRKGHYAAFRHHDGNKFWRVRVEV